VVPTQGGLAAGDESLARGVCRTNPWAVPEGTEEVLASRGLLRGGAVAMMPSRVLSRSVVHFVGDSKSPDEGCKWVVKRSNPRVHQDDLDEPLDATHEFESLVRAHGHLDRVSGISVPSPIGVLPDRQGFVDGFVRGTQVNRLLRRAWLLRTEMLLTVLTTCGRFLRHVHEIDGYLDVEVVPATLAADIQGFVEGPLAAAGLTVPPATRDALQAASVDPVPAVAATLHGDFAPVNFIVRPDGDLAGFDLGLRTVAVVERDLARFIAMLSTDRPFLISPHARPLERFRRSMIAALMEGYGERRSHPSVLQLALIDELLRRWMTRHGLSQGGGGHDRAARYMLRKRFTALLEEACSPAGP
jgi:aminoglycoside phosphotransferase (APT) family kinase protein